MRPLEVYECEWWDASLAEDTEPRDIRPEVPDLDADPESWRTYLQGCVARRAEMVRLSEEHPYVVLHGILMNEVDYVQFTGRRDELNKPIRVHFWQAGYMLDNIVVAFCGRDLGKSTSLKWKLEQRITNYPSGSAIITGHQEDRVGKIWTETIMTEMRQNWWSKHFFSDAEGASRTRNPFHQFFANGFRLYGRPASEQTARKVESPHCHSLFGDEWQEYEWTPWEKLQPALNDFETSVAHGGCHFLSGVNSEGRTDIVFYDIAFNHPFYRDHCYRLASWLNPKYSLSVHIKYLATYDHSVESSRFKQMIRGLTGEREKALVPAQDYHACVLQARNLFGFQEKRHLRIGNVEWLAANKDPETLFAGKHRLELWDGGLAYEDDPDEEMRVLSMDYGSSEPSEIGIWYRVLNPSPEATDRNRYLWLLWQRITLQGIQASDQAAIVDYLATFYSLDYLSIDSTGSTDAVSQILTDIHNPVYSTEEKDYRNRLYPASSNRNIPVRYELEEPDDRNLAPAGTRWKKIDLATGDGGYRLPVWVLEQNSNVLASNLVAQLVIDRVFCFAGGDKDFQHEILSVAEVQRPGKQPTYTAGGSAKGLHRFSMMRCFTLWHHVFFTIKERRREIVGEEAAEYYGGHGTALVGFGRVKPGGGETSWSEYA